MNNIINRLYLLLLGVLTLGLSSCSTEIDNWDYPSSTIAGQFLYKGQPIQIIGTGSDATSSNIIQLHQVGPQWDQGFVKMFAREDGTYTIETFDGDYYLNITPGRGPWLPSTDTLRLTLNGESKGINFNITPYFWISDYNSTYKDSVFSATFNLEKVVADAALEKVVINLGNTAIVDNTSKIYEKSFTTLTTGTNTISLDLKSLSASDKANLGKTGFVFARIGVKTKNVTDLIYSKVQKL